MLMRISSVLGEFESCDRSFARRAQNPNIADVIFQVEPEIKMFWLPISLLFSSKIITRIKLRLSKYWGIFTSPSANNC